MIHRWRGLFYHRDHNEIIFFSFYENLVTFAAVIRVVTQRSSPLSVEEALRDDSNDGCGGD